MKKLLFLLTIYFFTLFLAQAQEREIQIKGRIHDHKNKIVANASIEIFLSDGKSTKSQSNASGMFGFTSKKSLNVNRIVVKKAGYIIKEWSYDKERLELNVSMQNEGQKLKGKVEGDRVRDLKIVLKGINDFSPIHTDSEGHFLLVLPQGYELQTEDAEKFFIDEVKVPKKDIKLLDANTYIKITRSKVEVPKTQVFVWKDGKIRPKTSISIDNEPYITDKKGGFVAKNAVNDKNKIEVEPFEVEKTNYEADKNVLNVFIKDKITATDIAKSNEKSGENLTTNSVGEENEVIIDLKDIENDFDKIVEALEEEKRFLAEKSSVTRTEISRLNDKLQSGDLSPAQKQSLRAKLQTLEGILAENNEDYARVQQNTKLVIDKMREAIIQKDSLNSLTQEKLQVVESEKKQVEEESRRNILIASVIVIFLVILAIIFYRISRKMRHQNTQLARQATQLQEAFEQIKVKSETLEQQKSIIEKKNANITASINYAKRIQTAMLPQAKTINSLLPESFVLFKPKEIVSGDFYWIAEYVDLPSNTEKILIAAVDCTGHGVPGAFMSMVGDGLLSQIVKLQHISSPEQILNELELGIKDSLQQDQTANVDGMDIALCSIDKKNKILEFAGARNPLIYIQNGKLIELEANSISIGGNEKANLKKQISTPAFSKKTIHLNDPVHVYLFSDGYQDQFGGENNRKFSKRQLYDFFLQIHELPAPEQDKLLNEKLLAWQGNLPQTDDILLIGFKI